MSNKARVEISEDTIRIYDDKGNEILSWIEEEWVDEPSVVYSIATAVSIALTKGTDAINQILSDGVIADTEHYYKEEGSFIIEGGEN